MANCIRTYSPEPSLSAILHGHIFYAALSIVLMSHGGSKYFSNDPRSTLLSPAHNRVSTLQNLSSGFPTKRDSNQSPQLQRRTRILKIRLKQVEIWYMYLSVSEWQRRRSAWAETQAGLRLCCSQTLEDLVSRVEPHIILVASMECSKSHSP